jgi:hypothetical protein
VDNVAAVRDEAHLALVKVSPNVGWPGHVLIATHQAADTR